MDLIVFSIWRSVCLWTRSAHCESVKCKVRELAWLCRVFFGMCARLRTTFWERKSPKSITIYHKLHQHRPQTSLVKLVCFQQPWHTQAKELHCNSKILSLPKHAVWHFSAAFRQCKRALSKTWGCTFVHKYPHACMHVQNALNINVFFFENMLHC